MNRFLARSPGRPPARSPIVPRRSLPKLDLAFVLLYSMAIPFAVYLAIAVVSTLWLGYVLTIVATAYLITGVMVVIEAAVAAPRKDEEGHQTDADRSGDSNFPSVTALIAAYLPTEQDIIVDTVRHFLTTIDVPRDKLEVILAYNTPAPLPVEHELAELAKADPRLVVLRVEESTSKAENVNAGVRNATGEVIGLFDADHHPEPACFRKALRWFDDGYDIVQGRCVIRNGSDNWLSRLISIEFGTMYAVAHEARSRTADTAIFGGSNGYWTRKALQRLKLDPSMLTEDIDVTARALVVGYRVKHDRSIVSTELAPLSITSWFYQRLRWAQGWHQVTKRHTRRMIAATRLTRGQRLYWAYLLPWRETFAAIAPQALPILVAIVVVQFRYGGYWLWDPYLTGTTVLTFASGAATTYVAYRHSAASGFPMRRLDAVLYAIASPFFALAQNIVMLVSWLRESQKNDEWIPTPRDSFAYSASERMKLGFGAESTTRVG